jgi:hypothetical protein
MDAKFLPSSARKGAAAAQRSPGDAATPVGRADLACCCASRAAVRVTMRPTVARPEPTDLLLCGHHYRVSRRALEAPRAAVRNLPGISPDVAAWIDLIPITRLSAFAEG